MGLKKDWFRKVEEPANDERLFEEADDAKGPAQQDKKSVFESTVQTHARFLEDLQKRTSGELQLVSTGIRALDEHFAGGLGPDELTIIAGRPGRGKSTLGAQIAEHVAREKPVLFVSLEMSEVQVHRRRLVAASRGKLDTRMLLRPDRISGEDKQAIDDAALQLAPHFFLRVTTESSVEAITSQIYEHVEVKGVPALIVIDYLQLMTSEGSEHRALEVGKISRSLLNLALTLHVPVVALAQINREVDKRTSRRPMLSDLRESGSIEQDAANVIFVHDERADEEIGSDGPNTLIVAKARNFGQKDLPVFYRKSAFRFEDVTFEGTGHVGGDLRSVDPAAQVVPALACRKREVWQATPAEIANELIEPSAVIRNDGPPPALNDLWN